MLVLIALIKRIRFKFPNWVYKAPAYTVGNTGHVLVY
jgi:hypothetical protein